MSDHHNPFAAPSSVDTEAAIFAAESPARIPTTVLVPILLLALISAYTGYSAVVTRGHFFWGVPIAAQLAFMFGLYQRKQVAWYWTRTYSQTLTWLCAVPIVMGVGALLFTFFGGKLANGAGTVYAMMLLIGVFALIPIAAFTTIYVCLGTDSAKAYCRVCSNCMSRIRIPAQAFFAKWGCEHCPR